MSAQSGLWKRLARHQWAWKLYHALVADAVSIQRPTKYKYVREFLGEKLGSAADLGCGPGVFVRFMSKRAKYVVEIDIDRNSLGRVSCRNGDLDNVAFVNASAMDLPLADESIDTVLFLEVLEHLTDDRGALEEVRRVLRPGGRLVVSVPVPPGEVDEDFAWGHKREGYQLEDISKLLVEGGYEVEKHAFAEFKYSRTAGQAIRWWRKAAKLPAPIFFFVGRIS